MSQNNPDVSLPIKRNSGATLRERMSENAYEKILPARYLQKNGDGTPIESQEDLFERVAKNIAVAEAVHTDEEVRISAKHVKPGHPRRAWLVTMAIGGADSALLTEENACYVSYDALIDDVGDETRDVMTYWKAEFQTLMEHLEFVPNTPTLINAGNELQQLSACFVDSPADDIYDIHETAREAAEVFQSGGGMGYSFSDLRPYGDKVGSTGGIASGPITFMRTFDQMCETIAQGGARRGAQMGIMRIDHPDVVQFIHAKNKDVSLAETLKLNDPDDYRHNSFGEALEEARDLITDGKVPDHLRNATEGHLSNFNISVAVTDAFMEALEAGEEYELINPRTGKVHVATAETEDLYSWFGLGEYVTAGEPLRLPADAMWDRIIEGAWENGEPGIIFIDQVNEMHSFDVDAYPEHEIKATNPCGEQPLEQYEACNLGHINLSTIVSEDAVHWEQWWEHAVPVETHDEPLADHVEAYLTRAIDWEALNERIVVATRFLDNVVTMSLFPIEEIEHTVRTLRKIGLGIMGLAQLYIQLGMRYGSEEANLVAEQLMTHINHYSKTVSCRLADERGSFAAWDESKYASPAEYRDWFEHHTGKDADDWPEGFPIRNHNTTTIAPTGTTSMVGNTSSGCEPLYNVAYYKNVSDDVQGDEMLVEFDDYFLRVLEENDIDVDAVKAEAAEQMAENRFDGVGGLSGVPEAIAKLFVTTQDLTGREHADVQLACQKGVDSSISKTVNFPHSATREDVRDVFEHIHRNGGKSTTVYRDGTRTKQVLTTRAENTELGEDADFETWLGASEHDGLLDLLESEDFDAAVADADAEVAYGESGSFEQAEARPRSRPDVTWGETHNISTGYGGLYVTINRDEYGPHEVFATVGKSGGFTQSLTEALARLSSLCLRSGVSMDDVIDQLEGIRSPRPSWDNGDSVESIPDGVALALSRHLEAEGKMKQVAETVKPEEEDYDADILAEDDGGVEAVVAAGESPECPTCGNMVQYIEGCKKCTCGWSECG